MKDRFLKHGILRLALRAVCRFKVFLLSTFAASALVAGCAGSVPAPHANPTSAESPLVCEAPAVRRVAERLGERLKQVSLQAPHDILVREIREAYTPLVTGSLLAMWVAHPAHAPGREVSSPWPERIEIRSVEAAGPGQCRVVGDVVYLTSVEMVHGGAALRQPVTLRVSKDGEWRVSTFRVTAPATPNSSLHP